MKRIMMLFIMIGYIAHTKSMDNISGLKKRTYDEFTENKMMIGYILNQQNMQETEESQQVKRQKILTCTHQGCGKKFRQDYLKAHLRIHTGERPFKCEQCGKAFKQKNHLTTHLIVHTREKRFVCEVCEKAFSYHGGLKKHVIIHAENKQLVHDDYDKAFLREKPLKKHLNTYTSEMLCCAWHPWEQSLICNHNGCGKVFTQQETLMKHIKTMHEGDVIKTNT